MTYTDGMVTLSDSIPARALRDDLASVVGRVGYGHERVGITRHGKLAAVLIGVDDLELLEQLENDRDLAEYRAAKSSDDGTRVPLADLLVESEE